MNEKGPGTVRAPGLVLSSSSMNWNLRVVGTVDYFYYTRKNDDATFDDWAALQRKNNIRKRIGYHGKGSFAYPKCLTAEIIWAGLFRIISR